MNWLDKLERKYRYITIPNLMKYIVGMTALVYSLSFIDKSFSFIRFLTLDPYLVMKGQIWRLVTYIFIPPTTSRIWIIITLYFYYMVGTGLEEEWGSFKFNLYYIIGMLGTTLGAFITKSPTTATYLNLSLFLAFARIYPNFQLLLFFIVPIKIKYLALLNWIFIGYTVLFYPIPFKLAALVSVINYFIFFGKDISYDMKNRKDAHSRRRKFQSNVPKKDYIHKCSVCGITEKDNPDMDFRYCSQCEGDYEYCMTHLKNHEHIKKTTP